MTPITNLQIQFVLEDSKGNLWFGTNGEGVSKYDGINFTDYRVGLVNDIVNFIIENSNGNMWFGTNIGISKFSYSTVEKP